MREFHIGRKTSEKEKYSNSKAIVDFSILQRF